MDRTRFDDITRKLVAEKSRRAVLGRVLMHGTAALAAAVAGQTLLPEEAEAKRLCRKNGTRCRKKGRRCKAKYCRPLPQVLQAPFSIEAQWTSMRQHDTYFFVPNAEGSSDPSPHVDYHCTPAQTFCIDDVYPFTCVSQDAGGPGDEVTTVSQLLDGAYEYWIGLHYLAPAGDVTVRLRDAEGQLLRTWSSPENPSDDYRLGWHVFDLDGAAGSITSVDQLVLAEVDMPYGAHEPNTDVCPY